VPQADSMMWVKVRIKEIFKRWGFLFTVRFKRAKHPNQVSET
jgi:hypothetical protein